MKKKCSRIRRAKKTRLHIKSLEVYRLSVHKTSQHMYAQLLTSDGSKTLVTASTLDKQVRSDCKSTGNKDAAAKVGQLIAKRAKEMGVDKVAFDRSGFLYHGRVKALADAAREAGLIF